MTNSVHNKWKGGNFLLLGFGFVRFSGDIFVLNRSSWYAGHTHLTVPNLYLFLPPERRCTHAAPFIHRNTTKVPGLKSTPYIGDGHPTFNRESFFSGYINPDEISFIWELMWILTPAHINPKTSAFTNKNHPNLFWTFHNSGPPRLQFHSSRGTLKPDNFHGWQAERLSRT